MNEVDALAPRDLDRMVIEDPQGNPLACLAIAATFYVEDSDAAGPRLQIGRFIDRYLELVAPHLVWALDSDAKLSDLRRRPLGSILPTIQGTGERDAFSLVLSGAPDFDHASPYSLECSLRYRRPNKNLGYVSASFPLGFLEGREDGFFFDWVKTACNDLGPLHGYAGLTLIRSMDIGARRAADLDIYPLAARFSGLEIDEPVSHVAHLREGIKGVNWLTMVNDRLLDRIGGRGAVRARLGATMMVHDYPKGLIFQAGPFPQIGDSEAGSVPRCYREVYRVLKPLQADYPDILIETPAAVDPMQFKVAWMTRFD